jgi:hypothetical protein
MYRRRRKLLGARYRSVRTLKLLPLADNVFRFISIHWTRHSQHLFRGKGT